MMPEISDLKIFIAVAEAGSISRAAETLNYVQSNVTGRIKLMEERLGVPLFIRMSRGVTMTASGRLLQDYATRILALSGEAERMLKEKEAPSGTLVLGCLETAAAVRLPPILSDYHRRFPQVDLQVITGTAEEQVNHVLDYRVDAAFIGGEVDHPDLAAVPVFQEELVLATGKGTSVESNPRRTLIVFRRGCSYRAKFEGWLRDNGYLPYRVMEFGTVDGILGCVKAGMGMTVLPRAVFKDDPELSLQELPPQVAHVDTMLVSRRDVVATRAMTEFHKVVQDHSVQR
jgi:LysR family transcriptional regulator, cell division regulator